MFHAECGGFVEFAKRRLRVEKLSGLSAALVSLREKGHYVEFLQQPGIG